MRTIRTLVFGLLGPIFPIALCLGGGPARALDYDPTLAELGAESFRSYCASCHGVEARGDGPVAASLSTPPSDLRRIAERRGGEFPAGEIARKIDGRFEIDAHGPRDMPIWGRTFTADVPDAAAAESIARGRVAVLVEYLKSIQETGAPSDPAATRQTMQSIFAAMTVLLPLSLDGDAYEDPANAQKIGDALAVLDANSAGLSKHGASSDVSFAHLARSLAIDTRDIRLRYAEGHVRESRYLVQTLTETCVACHSRLPSGSAPQSAAFVRELEQAHLPIDQRAKLAYATRQFDVAADLYEQMLVTEPPNDLDLSGHLDDYLELTLRVLRSPEQALASMESFEKRKGMSPALREDVTAWVASLKQLVKRPPKGDALAKAHALLRHEDEGNLEFSRTALVEHLEASGLLHRALETGLEGERRAEAYYLLGWIETRIGRTYWLSQAEAYLETAIRLSPGSETAARAYDLLEEFLVAGYTGSSGSHVPPDIQTKLDALRWIALPDTAG
ncbi:MAG: c-type cytochrome [Myxococcota bacterium]